VGFIEEDWIGYITIDGKRAYNCGNHCTTCAFFFQRLEGATKSLNPAGFQHALSEGISAVAEEHAELLKDLLPVGRFEILLFAGVPKLVTPGGESDYFCREQLELWGPDAERCQTPYYRLGDTDLADGERVFEFIIPMLREGSLDQNRVQEFCAQIERGARPTALALSILYGKQPACWDGEPAVTFHHCLAHYLLDGHHKVFAASQVGKPIGLMSALALRFGQEGPTLFRHMDILGRLPGLVPEKPPRGRLPDGFRPKSGRWRFW
jgi:hypothetical protein